LLAAVGKKRADLAHEPKSAPWKVAVAAEMKASTTATNHWLGQALGMGSPYTVSRLASACRVAPGRSAPFLRAMAKRKA
jgi:putative transposase